MANSSKYQRIEELKYIVKKLQELSIDLHKVTSSLTVKETTAKKFSNASQCMANAVYSVAIITPDDL